MIRKFKYGKDDEYYQVDFKLFTYNMVTPPGFPGARLFLNDLVEVRPLGPPLGHLFFLDINFTLSRVKFKYGK